MRVRLLNVVVAAFRRLAYQQHGADLAQWAAVPVALWFGPTRVQVCTRCLKEEPYETRHLCLRRSS